MIRALALAALLLTALLPARPAGAGEVVAGHFMSPTLGRAWNYEIYLPTGYESGTRHYPVVYLLHGAGDDATSWIIKAEIGAVADRMIANGTLQPCIVVMPTSGRSWYVNGPERMETAFIGDLLPEIDRTYRTLPDRRDRMIGGLSMGGYGAMRLALRYPDRFSAVALMSPAIYAPEPPPNSSARLAPAFQTNGIFDLSLWQQRNYPALLDDFARAHLRLRMQLAAGLQDGFHTGRAAEQFYEAWRARGWSAELRLLPGAHDFVFWRAALPQALRFLAGPPRIAQSAQPGSAPQTRN